MFLRFRSNIKHLILVSNLDIHASDVIFYVSSNSSRIANNEVPVSSSLSCVLTSTFALDVPSANETALWYMRLMLEEWTLVMVAVHSLAPIHHVSNPHFKQIYDTEFNYHLSQQYYYPRGYTEFEEYIRITLHILLQTCSSFIISVIYAPRDFKH